MAHLLGERPRRRLLQLIIRLISVNSCSRNVIHARQLSGVATKEVPMKLAIPGVIVTALIVGSPAVFAQNYGNAPAPSAGVAKDDTGMTTKKSKKHASMHTRSYAKHMRSKSSTTGYGNASEPGIGVNKDETTPKTTR